MILLGSALTNAPIMGIQTGSEIARTKRAVIDPGTLAVLAYEVAGASLDNSAPNLLRVADVREFSDLGFIVDSSDEFIHPDDVMKLKDVYDRHFSLLGMPVIDEKRHKLGKIIDFTLETGGFIIQQLTVRRPLLKSLNDTELLIHRSQIIEINNDAIVVHSQAKAPEPELHEVVGSYVNPFRKSKPAQESVDRK
ncbi:MAG: PRC-barrel domain-containing protein [Acidobacteriota bacterium]